MAEVFLITPAAGEPAEIATLLQRMLAATQVPALLVARDGRDDAAYRALVSAVLPVAQAAGTAVLVEGEPGDVRGLKADGLHVAGAAAVKAAVAALKPEAIVGAVGNGSRHAAMEAGERGVDYVMFGPLSGAISDADRELAAWWAETMEVPSVLSDPAAGIGALRSEGCEFVALRDVVWNADDPVAALAAAAAEIA